jgi:hypothetical protein
MVAGCSGSFAGVDESKSLHGLSSADQVAICKQVGADYARITTVSNGSPELVCGDKHASTVTEAGCLGELAAVPSTCAANLADFVACLDDGYDTACDWFSAHPTPACDSISACINLGW